jgi:hypothetical protein
MGMQARLSLAQLWVQHEHELRMLRLTPAMSPDHSHWCGLLCVNMTGQMQT